MDIKRLVIIVMIGVALSGCSGDSLSVKGYMNYYNQDHAVTVEAGSLSYGFNVFPASYIALRDAGYTNGDYDHTKATTRLNEISGKTFVRLKITNKASSRSPLQHNATSAEVLQQRMEYYSFAAEQDLKCLCGTDTLHPLDYSFEENFNLSNYAVINAVFDTCDQKQFTLIFDDRSADQLALKASFNQSQFPKLKNSISHE